MDGCLDGWMGGLMEGLDRSIILMVALRLRKYMNDPPRRERFTRAQIVSSHPKSLTPHTMNSTINHQQ